MAQSSESEAIPSIIITAQGVIPTPYRVHSLAEAVAHEPRGVYTVTRTFHGDHALLFDVHLDRLEQSARLSDIPLKLDRDRLRAVLRALLHDAGFPDAKFRITVPREHADQIYLSLEALQPVPEDVLRDGARLATTSLVRDNPIVKTTDWMMIRQPTFRSLPPGVYEGLLVNGQGRVLEGMSSNFYGVLDGVLYTAGEGVLEGITRRAVIEIAPALLPVQLTALHLDELPRLSEAMITSSSRGVVPVTAIDGLPVGDGRVGSVVTALRLQYNAWTESHSEPI